MKKVVSVITAFIMILALSMSSLAAGWRQYESGEWAYIQDNGKALTDSWLESGGAWYYLGPDGLLLTSNYTPDGYWVNEFGIYEPQWGRRTDTAAPFSGTTYTGVYGYTFYLDHYADGVDHWSMKEFYPGSSYEKTYELYEKGPFAFEIMDILEGRTVGYLSVSPSREVVYVSIGGHTDRCGIGQ